MLVVPQKKLEGVNDFSPISIVSDFTERIRIRDNAHRGLSPSSKPQGR